jgi:hypothetical protein
VVVGLAVDGGEDEGFGVVVIDIVDVVDGVGGTVLGLAVVVGGPEPLPRYCTTSSWKPGFWYSWLISHIITPPKLPKSWL